ncbi:hypothetical protein BDZ45DRAFT_737345 [Acephala macrosclerotiorum]|nr:hypothetical protein BDZ45DRAFT_737345 [Acephala macrosclerotiorum]
MSGSPRKPLPADHPNMTPGQKSSSPSNTSPTKSTIDQIMTICSGSDMPPQIVLGQAYSFRPQAASFKPLNPSPHSKMKAESRDEKAKDDTAKVLAKALKGVSDLIGEMVVEDDGKSLGVGSPAKDEEVGSEGSEGKEALSGKEEGKKTWKVRNQKGIDWHLRKAGYLPQEGEP